MGRTFVELVIQVERTMDAVRHVYPATDHLARRPSRVPAEVDSSLAVALRSSTHEVADLFDRWRELCSEFFDVAADLDQLRDGKRFSRGTQEQHSYNTRLDECIARVHALRLQLVDATEELQGGVIAELDRRIACNHPSRRLAPGAPVLADGAMD
jgi:hypothetical protein